MPIVSEGQRSSTLPALDGSECEPESFVEEEILVEEISIDGMCGVY